MDDQDPCGWFRPSVTLRSVEEEYGGVGLVGNLLGVSWGSHKDNDRRGYDWNIMCYDGHDSVLWC